MASVSFIGNGSQSDIDYSLKDGRVRSFTLRGVKMYDESDGTAAHGWRDRLVAFIRQQGLEFDEHAFLQKMRADGLLQD